MTIPRPPLAAVAAKMLIKGEHPVTPMVFAALSTDMEGALGRFIDKKLPDSGLGSSEFGAEADIVADTLALLEICGAALIAPRVPVAGKLAVATTLGHEGMKAVWGLNKNRLYRKAGGSKLYIPPTDEGKCSMAEKMMAVGLAVLASDFDDQRIRQPLALTSLALAGIGTLRGEEQRQIYENVANEMIANLQGTPPPAAENRPLAL